MSEQLLARATRLLPAWFVERMLNDEWYFGLLLSCGRVLGVTSISAVHLDANGALWIDVNMLDEVPYLSEGSDRLWGKYLMVSPTSRTMATVNASHIVAAFELSD